MAKSKRRTEFGDFQTPRPLADEVCNLLLRTRVCPTAIIEPTCGEGTLLLSALKHFPNAGQAIGLDINAAHLSVLERTLANSPNSEKARLICASFFDTDWSTLVAGLDDQLLVIGNPPWVTNAGLGVLASTNLPRKANFQGHSGLDAITGKSNFDISESILLRVMHWLNARSGIMAMLCKTAVARKLLYHAWSMDLHLESSDLYGIDAMRHFRATVDACLMVCRFGPGSRSRCADVFATMDSALPVRRLGWREGQVISDTDAYDKWEHLAVDGAERKYQWRSGVKHDCSTVMELRDCEGRLFNKLGKLVDIEPTFLFPMLKSSQVAKGCTNHPSNWMIVTQRSVSDDTALIRNLAPKTWSYLSSHADLLDARRSSIYLRRPRFSVFGVGDYTFAPYKVAISGFYKHFTFEVVEPYQDSPVVFDDTVYFLPCQTKKEAELYAELLNSVVAQEFFSAFVFWDAKRPITADLLRRLDLSKLADHLGLSTVFNRVAPVKAEPSPQRVLF
ncbi:MAG: hypothetical protein WD851_15255 [Pirellulales bacterium]